MEKQIIPEGYKQTDVGVIPKDWDVVTVSDVCNTGSGTTPPRNNFARYFDKGTNWWVKTTDLNNSVLAETEECVTDIALKETSLKLYPAETVLVAMYGGFNQIGRTGLTKIPACVNQALVAISPMGGKLNSRYLLDYLNFRVDYWKTVASSSRKDPNITSSDVKAFPIPLPPFEEQNAIANALSDIDDLIASLEKLIAKKRDIKTGTLQKLLTGKTRLPQFANHPDGTPKGMKSSELGEIPEDWKIRRIGEFTDCAAGGTPNTQTASYWGGTHPWMSSGELHLKRVADVAERITDEGLKNSSTKYVPELSVLIGLAGQGKTRGTVAINLIELCTNQSIAAIFPSSAHNTEYLFYSLESRYDELRGMSTGDGGRGGLNLTIIRKVLIPMPSLAEQKAIATVLSDMDIEIEYLSSQLTKTRSLKQGMMQELLTGKTRLV